jgi:hypothetical protein
VTDGSPTYLGGGDPARRFTNYYPAWLDNLAEDVTIEGSLLDGVAQGSADGHTRHIAANYRPRSSLLLLSRLTGEKLAGTPYARSFAPTET